MDWSSFLDVGVGLGVLLIGAGILVLCLRLSRLVARATTSLDEVDRQLAAIAPPLLRTLSHVGGIADTADSTLARLSGAVGSLEALAGGVARTAAVAQGAVNPAVVNFGATITTLSARLRRLVVGRETASVNPYRED